jgi:uncharacterized protein YqeY
MQDRLSEDLKAAMRARDAVRTRTLRSLRAALLEKEIELREGGSATLTDDQILAVIQKQAKQRRDALEQFDAAGRDDLSAKEKEELAIIETYLPKQLSVEEVEAVVGRIIEETGASSMKEIGKVMGPAMKELKGLADGRVVQEVVRSLLGA